MKQVLWFEFETPSGKIFNYIKYKLVDDIVFKSELNSNVRASEAIKNPLKIVWNKIYL